MLLQSTRLGSRQCSLRPHRRIARLVRDGASLRRSTISDRSSSRARTRRRAPLPPTRATRSGATRSAGTAASRRRLQACNAHDAGIPGLVCKSTCDRRARPAGTGPRHASRRARCLCSEAPAGTAGADRFVGARVHPLVVVGHGQCTRACRKLAVHAVRLAAAAAVSTRALQPHGLRGRWSVRGHVRTRGFNAAESARPASERPRIVSTRRRRARWASSVRRHPLAL